MTEQEELELIKKNSPYALPDNPAESGWSTAQIKEKFYAGLIVIYNLFKESRTSQNNNITNITSLVNTINEQYEGIINNQTLKVKYDSESNEIVTTYAKIVDLVSGNVAALKYLKSDGATSEFIYKIEQDLAQLTTNFNLVKNWADNLKSVNSQEAVQRAVRATQDDLGNIIRNTYATVANLTSLSTTVTNIINGTLIVDKAAKDASGNSISTTYATKVENALKVAYADIVNALNDTSTNKPLSAAKGKELQDQITAIQTLLASNDTDLDQLQEIVAYIKNNKSLIDGITTNKINYSDIIDNLTSEIAGKPLSANQGYVLKGMIDMIHTTLVPTTTDIYDLGSSIKYYKDIYFKGNLKDGTNSISVADIAQAMVDILGLQNDTPSNLALLKTYTQSNTDLADAVSKKHSHSNKDLLDTYNQTNANIADAVDKKHSHSNKAVLDGIDAAKVADWNDKYTQAQTDSKVANAVNIAKGKTASYVIELADNPSFNSTSDSITLSDSLTLTCVDGTTVTLGDLKDGDNILITDVNVPDRWVAQITTSGQTKVYMMASLETRVVDLTPYAAVDTTSTANSGDVLLYNSSTHKMEKCPNGTYIVKNGKLSALVTDEISDTNQSNKFVSENEKAYVNEHTLNSLNLFSGFKTYKYSTSDGSRVINSSYLGTDYIPVKPNTTYTLSAFPTYTNHCVFYYTNSATYIERTSGDNIATRTFTTPSNCYYITIGYTNSLTSAQVSEGINAQIMLNEGSEAQSYQPYNRNEHITNQDVDNIDKALYHLGAFDTISGNTITRQTGYAYGKDYMDKTILRNSANNPYINTYISVNALDKFVGNCPKVDSNSWWSVTFTTPTLTYDSNGNTLIVMLPNGATDTSALQDIQIQYKLATPYTEQVIENQPLLNLDQNGCNFLRNEWEKGLNLFNINDLNFGTYLTKSGNSFTLNANYGYPNSIFKNVPTFKANTQYTFSGIKSNTTGGNRVDIKYTDGSLQTIATDTSGYFVVTSESGKTISDLICDYSISGSTTYTDFMMVEGSVAKPYQEYNGAIVHTKDIEPVLLWENPNPDSAFAGQDITIKDSSSFKYLVLEMKRTSSSTHCGEFIKIRNSVGTYAFTNFADDGSGSMNITSRSIYLSSTTSVHYYDGILNNASNNDANVPKAIYGTNVL